MPRPILYSFRRCPYAMRARLAVASAGIECELREILLRDKAPEFLAASATTTVPLLVNGDEVVEESFDIMLWALGRHDPEGWLTASGDMKDLIAQADGEFKDNLDAYKYASRLPEVDGLVARQNAEGYLCKLEARLGKNSHLFGREIGLADMAIAPFIRQFANVDRAWFDGQDWPHLQHWLEAFLASDRFAAIMTKYPKWQAGDPVTVFPESP